MKRILLLIKHQKNRHLLSQWLREHYQVLSPSSEVDFVETGKQLLNEDFDLCFIDFGAIHQLREQMLEQREKAAPTFLPFVFLTTLQDVRFSTNHLEQLIDDLVYLPIQKVELQTRLRMLLRSRFYSLKLKVAQNELQEALSREKELNQLKSRFVSMVSHEFRNPLNGISGMTQILKAYGDKLSTEKKAEVFAGLQRNVNKMTELLDDVLIISRKDLGKLQFKPTSVDLETFCRGLISNVQMACDRHQQIDFIYQPEVREFILDGKLLHHILTNLLLNACKYSPQDTPVEMKVSCSPSTIEIEIRDRGIGIPTEDLPNLFDVFYRASNSEGYQGTGLGLAIVKEYVELHQGKITVDSKLDMGTTFTVIIPRNL